MKKLLFVVCSLQLLVVFTGCTKEKRIVQNNIWEASPVEIDDSVNEFGFSNYIPSFTLTIIEMVKNKNIDWFVIEFKSEKQNIIGKVKIGHNKIDFHDIETSEAVFGGNISYETQYLINFLEDVNRYVVNGAALTLKSKKGKEIILINKKLGW